jgi:uncharacterized membrane protein YbhN (UPF0104 family)
VTVDFGKTAEVQPADGKDVQPVSTSVVRRGWGSSVFGIVAEGHARRRPSDIARVVVALVVIAIASAGATEVTTIESAVFDLIASLPGGLEPLWNVLYFLAPIVAGALLVTALVARRPRLLVTQAVAVGVAWLVGFAVSATVDVPDTLSDAGVALHGHTPDFPVVLVAASTAGLWASRPYLTRPARRLVEVVFWLSAIAAAALGEGLPGAVIASVVLAWGAAALAHLCFGSPAATPSEGQVADSLRDLGVDPSGLRLALEQTWGVTNYTAGSEAELSIEVVGRDGTDAQLFAKLWRFIWYKDSGPRLSLTREQQVEHQAYVLFLARRTGARLPDVVAAGLAGWRDDAIVVVRNPPGVSLSGVEPESVTDAILDDAWANLARLHDGRIAHGNPWVGNVVLDYAGTTGLVGLGDAVPSASDARLRLDRVQLLATTAQHVGAERALAAAHRGLSTDDLVELLAFLEPTALTGAAKRHLTEPKKLLTGLREAGAELTGVEPPKPTALRRFSASSVFLAAAFAVGVYLLVGQLAGVAAMGDIFKDAIWGWVLVTFVVAQLPQISQSMAMLGAVSARLPFGPVTGVQFANAFTGLVGGTAGNATLVIRFFQKQGLPPAVAASSGILTSAAGFIVQAVLIVIAVAVTGSEFNLSIGSDGEGIPGWLVAVIAVLVVAALVLLLVPSIRNRVRHTVVTQVRAAWQNLRGVLSTPRKAVQLFGGNLASQLLYAMVLGAALHAYGGSLPLLQLVLINCVASFIGGMAPVPGGMGVIETGLIAGFTASGIPEAQAVAATFTARLCTSYLPPIWGWYALSWLRKKDYV